MIVGFLIAGVQKSGTTSLDGWLRQHPAVGMARDKELHYFDNEILFASAAPSDAIYHAAFDATPGVLIHGEATPIYSYWSDAPRRIWTYNPRMRLIIILRNPIERAWSHWKMACRLNAEELNFSEAIRCETERCRVALPLQHRMYSYVDRGFYSEQIRRLRRFFPDEQLLFLKSETVFHDPHASLRRVCRFLSVPERAFEIGPPLNHDEGKVAMLPADRRYLRDRLRDDIRQTESLLGWRCPDWLD